MGENILFLTSPAYLVSDEMNLEEAKALHDDAVRHGMDEDELRRMMSYICEVNIYRLGKLVGWNEL